MKYPQLVQMPRDVEDWLEEQLKARGLDAVVYSRYILSLLQQENFDYPHEYLPSVSSQEKESKKEQKRGCHEFDIWKPWDSESLKHLAVVRCLMSASNEKYDIEKLVDELCVKLKQIEHKGSSHFEIIPSQCMADPSPIDAALQYYAAFPPLKTCYETECNPVTLPPNSAWTRGLLHDSKSDENKHIMEDYFSTLFCGNSSDDFGFGFTRNKSDERQDGDETDRINFYNKQNLLDSACSERLYERNADIDKLIAKFDANIEDIWKPSSNDSEDLHNLKCQTLFSQNILTDPYVQYGNNFVWSFKQNEDDGKNNEGIDRNKENAQEYKSSFSNWNKFSSPVLPNSGCGIDTMLSAVNLTLSNIQKWSAMDGQDNGTNHLLNHNKNGSCFTEVIPKMNAGEYEKSLSSGISSELNLNVTEEEDLLTSAKTHFRPIRMEEVQLNQTTVYADGTTFAISNELEKVPFKRSESGTLYLDSDAELDAPRKYKEYKEKDIYSRFDSESDLSSMEEFVPKFRIRQSNEKCCQTEEIIEDQLVPEINDTDCESDSYESEVDEFYFPGDDELAQNIINSIDEENDKKVQSDCNSNDIYLDNERMEILELTSFKKPEMNQCECGNGKDWQGDWERKLSGKQEWSEIWSPQETCESCKANSEKISTKDKYCRFREELTQDGEQLLSDLSCLQQLYSNSDWCDDDSTTASDFNDDELPNPNEEMIQNDNFFTCEMLDNYNNLKKDPSWKSLWPDEDESSKKYGLWCDEDNTLRKGNDEIKLNEINERPFIVDAVQKERKRRNSSSQKACNLYMEGQCRRPHCRFAHKDSAIPCPFYADASCLKGEACPLSHGLRRPSSL